MNIASKFYAETILKGDEYTPVEEDKKILVTTDWVVENSVVSDEWPEKYAHKING